VEGVGTFRDWGLAQFSFSGSGSLVYAEGRSADDLESTLVWVDRRGVAEPLPARPGVYGAIRLSPDGRRVAMTVAQSNSVDIWVYDITRDTLTRLTSDGNNFFPGWTPDGKKVRFESYTSGERNLFWKPADGSGPEEPVIPGEQLARGEISPDGRVFVYLGDTPTTKRDLWVVPLEGERKPRLFLQTPFNETGARWSPDGRWLAYVSDQSGRVEVYIRPFPGPGGEVQVSTDGASAIVGWRDGELFYRAGTNAEKMMVVESKTEPTLSVGKPRLLFESSYAFAGSSVTPDGQRFLMLKPSEQQNASLTQIHVVLNWFEELKRRVPAAR
jgi:serine/threonine-protein kinase